MRETISATIKDLVLDFMYYDRTDDEELPLGAVRAAIDGGDTSVEDVVWMFRDALEYALANNYDRRS